MVRLQSSRSYCVVLRKNRYCVVLCKNQRLHTEQQNASTPSGRVRRAISASDQEMNRLLRIREYYMSY